MYIGFIILGLIGCLIMFGWIVIAYALIKDTWLTNEYNDIKVRVLLLKFKDATRISDEHLDIFKKDFTEFMCKNGVKHIDTGKFMTTGFYNSLGEEIGTEEKIVLLKQYETELRSQA